MTDIFYSDRVFQLTCINLATSIWLLLKVNFSPLLCVISVNECYVLLEIEESAIF